MPLFWKSDADDFCSRACEFFLPIVSNEVVDSIIRQVYFNSMPANNPQDCRNQLANFFFFFLKFLADTCPFLGPLVPLFWISGDVSSGFQSQSGFCLIRYFCGGECNVHSPRFTSGATLADLLAAGAQPVTSPHACAEVGLGSVSNVRSHEQKTNALPLCQRPGFPVSKLGFLCPIIVLLSMSICYTHMNKC